MSEEKKTPHHQTSKHWYGVLAVLSGPVRAVGDEQPPRAAWPLEDFDDAALKYAAFRAREDARFRARLEAFIEDGNDERLKAPLSEPKIVG